MDSKEIENALGLGSIEPIYSTEREIGLGFLPVGGSQTGALFSSMFKSSVCHWKKQYSEQCQWVFLKCCLFYIFLTDFERDRAYCLRGHSTQALLSFWYNFKSSEFSQVLQDFQSNELFQISS